MNLTILTGDALTKLRELPDESVQCCVTSPPYWGLRDYGCEGQIGLEKTPQEFVAKMVAVFEEVRRVIKGDGTCWVNLGDSYANDTKWGGRTGGKHAAGLHGSSGIGRQKVTTGLKAKDLCGIPWRVAFALQDAGWYLRSDIIWAKPNPMPESVQDRPTKSHEYLFLLTKAERYYYDAAAIREPASVSTHARLAQNVEAQNGSTRANGGEKTNGNMKAVGGTRNSFARETKNTMGDHGQKPQFRTDREPVNYDIVRNKRTVWTVPTFSYSDAHFATYPPDLIKPCILAGSRPGDTVLDCFGGSGTTGTVALELGRKALLIELNPEYVKLIRQRCDVTPGFALTEREDVSGACSQSNA